MQATLIYPHQIHTLFIRVSEPIETKNQHAFFKYHIEKNQFEYTFDLKLFFFYMPSCKHYFIAFFSAPCKNCIIEPQVLQAFFIPKHQKQNAYTLFIAEHFFALFYKENLCYFKAIHQDVKEDQIVHFIEKSCHLSINQTVLLTKEHLNELTHNYINNINSFKPIIFKTNPALKKSKRLACVCLSLIMLAAAIFYSSSYIKQHQKKQIKLITMIPKKPSTSNTLVSVMLKLNALNLTFKSLHIANKKFSLTLLHPQKDILIDFVEHHRASIKRLNFNEKEALYELVAFFKLH